MKFNIKMRKVKTSKLDKLTKKTAKEAHRKASEDYRKEYLRKLNDAVSRKDFSQHQLSRMDHPYATKHGGIQAVGTLKDFMVHTRSGGFKNAFRIDTIGSNQYQSNVNISFEYKEDYQKYVFEGTSIMFGRNPIEGVRKQMEDQRRPARLLKKYIKKAIKDSMK